MATNVGDMLRFGNPLIDPATGQPLASPPGAFSTGGTAVDPDGVSLTIQRPDQTQLTYGWPGSGTDGVLTREAPGRFYADVILDQPGTWKFKLAGSGTVNAVEEGRIRVERSRVL